VINRDASKFLLEKPYPHQLEDELILNSIENRYSILGLRINKYIEACPRELTLHHSPINQGSCYETKVKSVFNKLCHKERKKKGRVIRAELYTVGTGHVTSR
jgi:hypothetical protein